MKNLTETLGIGSRAPDFCLSPANGVKPISLASLLAQSAVVLEFMRGTWCPNCRKRMVELESFKSQIWEAGGKLVCIAAEKRGGLWEPEKYLQNHPFPYPFLLDEDRAVVKAYGLYHRAGIDAWHIAHPATLVVDKTARVRYIYKGTSQIDRAPMEEVIAALRRLGNSNSGAK
jgi:peroxiredoxin Q/BCP